MKEKDIHELIEQQDPEAKQRIWNKMKCILSEHDKQSDCEGKSDNNGKSVQNENK